MHLANGSYSATRTKARQSLVGHFRPVGTGVEFSKKRPVAVPWLVLSKARAHLDRIWRKERFQQQARSDLGAGWNHFAGATSVRSWKVNSLASTNLSFAFPL